MIISVSFLGGTEGSDKTHVPWLQLKLCPNYTDHRTHLVFRRGSVLSLKTAIAFYWRLSPVSKAVTFFCADDSNTHLTVTSGIS